MAVPKRRKSHSRSRMAKAHKSMTRPTVVFCPNCGGATLPHRVCPTCGQYQGREVVEQKDA